MPDSQNKQKELFLLLKTACYTSTYFIAVNYFANETLLSSNRFIPDEFSRNEDDKNVLFRKVVKDYSP